MKSQRNVLLLRSYVIFQLFQGLSVCLQIQMMLKTLGDKKIIENVMDNFVIQLILCN